MMKLNLIIVLAAIVAGVCSQAQDGKADDAPTTIRLPKVFDFSLFKTLFNKSYRTAMEELARQRLYLGRAFKAFVSVVRYKHNTTTSYLGINHMSDWTIKELRSLFRRHSPGRQQPIASRQKQVVPVADLEEIETELANIVERKSESGYAEIAKELEATRRRKKRDTTASPSNDLGDLTVDDLLLTHNNSVHRSWKDFSRQFDTSASSTNEMSPEEASTISRLPGMSFLSSIIKSVSSMLFSEPRPKRYDFSELLKSRAHLPNQMFHDWRESGCLTPAKSQNNCGACYIFATMALFEWKLCREHSMSIRLSEQYAIDCGSRAGMIGCTGGHEHMAFEFIELCGLDTAARYPYLEIDGQCPYNSSVANETMGYIRLDGEHNMRLVEVHEFERALDEGPIVVSIDTDGDFPFYKGGIDYAPDCRFLDGGEGHAMLLVGDGIHRGREYWLFKNSFGEDFGESGYYKLSKESDCWMEYPQFGLMTDATFNNLNTSMFEQPAFFTNHTSRMLPETNHDST